MSPSPSLFTSGGTSSAAPFTPFESNANVPLDPTAATEKTASGTGRDDVKESEEEQADEKRANVKKSFFGWKMEKAGRDIEAKKPATRPTRLFAPVYNGLGAGLCLCTSSYSPR